MACRTSNRCVSGALFSKFEDGTWNPPAAISVETNILAAENGWLEYDPFLLKRGRKGVFHEPSTGATFSSYIYHIHFFGDTIIGRNSIRWVWARDDSTYPLSRSAPTWKRKNVTSENYVGAFLDSFVEKTELMAFGRLDNNKSQSCCYV